MKPSTSAKPRPTAIVLISDTLWGMGGSGWGVRVFYNGICMTRKKHAAKNPASTPEQEGQPCMTTDTPCDPSPICVSSPTASGLARSGDTTNTAPRAVSNSYS